MQICRKGESFQRFDIDVVLRHNPLKQVEFLVDQCVALFDLLKALLVQVCYRLLLLVPCLRILHVFNMPRLKIYKLFFESVDFRRQPIIDLVSLHSQGVKEVIRLMY